MSALAPLTGVMFRRSGDRHSGAARGEDFFGRVRLSGAEYRLRAFRQGAPGEWRLTFTPVDAHSGEAPAAYPTG